MAVIDNRLLNVDTDQDITENFNRVLGLIDNLNSTIGNINTIPDKLIIITKDNSTFAYDSDNDLYIITNQKLYNALKNFPEGDPNFKILFVDTGELGENFLGLSYGEVASDNPNSVIMYFDSGEATAEKFTFTASATANKTTMKHEENISYAIEE